MLHYRGDGRRGRQSAAGATLVPDGTVVYDPRQRDDRTLGVLAAPGIPEMLLAGREREFLAQFAFPAMSATPGAITEADVDEFARTYSRPNGLSEAPVASTDRCCRKARPSRLSPPRAR